MVRETHGRCVLTVQQSPVRPTGKRHPSSPDTVGDAITMVTTADIGPVTGADTDTVAGMGTAGMDMVAGTEADTAMAAAWE